MGDCRGRRVGHVFKKLRAHPLPARCAGPGASWAPLRFIRKRTHRRSCSCRAGNDESPRLAFLRHKARRFKHVDAVAAARATPLKSAERILACRYAVPQGFSEEFSFREPVRKAPEMLRNAKVAASLSPAPATEKTSRSSVWRVNPRFAGEVSSCALLRPPGSRNSSRSDMP